LFTNVYTGEKIQIFLFLSSFSNRALLSDATVQPKNKLANYVSIKIGLLCIKMKPRQIYS
jgi:hypothetical protein